MKKVGFGFLVVIIILVGIFSLENLREKNSQVNIIKNTGKEPNEAMNFPQGYKEIAKIIKSYELPKEGKIKEEGNFISYENGYEFFKNSKILSSRIVYKEGGPKKPTEGQYLGVIMGLVGDIYSANHWEDNADDAIDEIYVDESVKLDIDIKLLKLQEIQLYVMDYEAIKDWVDETIVYLQETKQILEIDTLKAKKSYDKALKNIKNFNKVIDLVSD